MPKRVAHCQHHTFISIFCAHSTEWNVLPGNQFLFHLKKCHKSRKHLLCQRLPLCCDECNNHLFCAIPVMQRPFRLPMNDALRTLSICLLCIFERRHERSTTYKSLGWFWTDFILGNSIIYSTWKADYVCSGFYFHSANQIATVATNFSFSEIILYQNICLPFFLDG